MKKFLLSLFFIFISTISIAAPTTVTVPIQVFPGLSFSPATITFSGIPVSSPSSPLQVTIKNVGGATINIGTIAFTGTNAADFSQTTDCSATLAINAICHINVTFTPSASGTRTATLNVPNTGGHTYTASVTGSTTTANLVFSPASFTFSQINVGTTSNPTTFTVTNTGTATATISGVTLIGTNASEFSQTHDCGSTLAANAICHVVVTFAPTSTGSKSASIQIATAIGGPYTASLSGSAITTGGGGVCP